MYGGIFRLFLFFREFALFRSLGLDLRNFSGFLEMGCDFSEVDQTED